MDLLLGQGGDGGVPQPMEGQRCWQARPGGGRWQGALSEASTEHPTARPDEDEVAAGRSGAVLGEMADEFLSEERRGSHRPQSSLGLRLGHHGEMPGNLLDGLGDSAATAQEVDVSDPKSDGFLPPEPEDATYQHERPVTAGHLASQPKELGGREVCLLGWPHTRERGLASWRAADDLGVYGGVEHGRRVEKSRAIVAGAAAREHRGPVELMNLRRVFVRALPGPFRRKPRNRGPTPQGDSDPWAFFVGALWRHRP
jgi:hypothetical protein